MLQRAPVKSSSTSDLFNRQTLSSALKTSSKQLTDTTGPTVSGRRTLAPLRQSRSHGELTRSGAVLSDKENQVSAVVKQPKAKQPNKKTSVEKRKKGGVGGKKKGGAKAVTKKGQRGQIGPSEVTSEDSKLKTSSLTSTLDLTSNRRAAVDRRQKTGDDQSSGQSSNKTSGGKTRGSLTDTSSFSSKSTYPVNKDSTLPPDRPGTELGSRRISSLSKDKSLPSSTSSGVVSSATDISNLSRQTSLSGDNNTRSRARSVPPARESSFTKTTAPPPPPSTNTLNKSQQLNASSRHSFQKKASDNGNMAGKKAKHQCFCFDFFSTQPDPNSANDRRHFTDNFRGVIDNVKHNKSLVEGMLLKNVMMGKDSEFEYVHYCSFITKTVDDVMGVKSKLRQQVCNNCLPGQQHYFGAFRQLATTASGKTKSLAADEPAIVKKPKTKTTAYIISAFKLLPNEDQEKMDKDWPVWSGAQQIYKGVPSVLGVRNITFFKALGVDSEVVYVLMCECQYALNNIGLACSYTEHLRVQKIGEVGLFTLEDDSHYYTAK